MTQPADTEHPPDICLLLRVHAEQRWLANEVTPLLRALEPAAITPPSGDCARPSAAASGA
jgi:hypothetical protein